MQLTPGARLVGSCTSKRLIRSAIRSVTRFLHTRQGSPALRSRRHRGGGRSNGTACAKKPRKAVSCAPTAVPGMAACGHVFRGDRPATSFLSSDGEVNDAIHACVRTLARFRHCASRSRRRSTRCDARHHDGHVVVDARVLDAAGDRLDALTRWIPFEIALTRITRVRSA